MMFFAVLAALGGGACRSTFDSVGVGEACDDDERRCAFGATCVGGRCQAPPAPPAPPTAPPPTPARKVEPAGCADRTREGFHDRALYPTIASCSGGWTVRGVLAGPTCNRRSGSNDTGIGCAAADLCADGWHICESLDEVRTHAHGLASCDDAIRDPAGNLQSTVFFASAQLGFDRRMNEGTQCMPTEEALRTGQVGHNNVYGCASSDIGAGSSHPSCLPFRLLAYRTGQQSDCSLWPPWDCTGSGGDTTRELEDVVKYGPGKGGVLCCIDGDAQPDPAFVPAAP